MAMGVCACLWVFIRVYGVYTNFWNNISMRVTMGIMEFDGC